MLHTLHQIFPAAIKFTAQKYGSQWQDLQKIIHILN